MRLQLGGFGDRISFSGLRALGFLWVYSYEASGLGGFGPSGLLSFPPKRNLLVARACVLVIYIFCLASCMGSTKFNPLRDLSFPVANDKQAAVAFLQSKSSLSHMLYM